MLEYNSEVINSDERIEENLFLNNNVLDDSNLENGDVSSMNQSGITNFEIKSPLLLQNCEEKKKAENPNRKEKLKQKAQ